MILKYLPICLFVFNTAKAQQTLTIQEPSAPIAFIEAAPSFASDFNLSEPAPAAAPAPYYSDGESLANIFFNLELGFWNRTMASYNGTTATGGGTRYGGNVGAQFMLPCRHNGHKMASASVGFSTVYIRDNYSEKGPAGSKNSEYHLTNICLPLMYTTTYYGKTTKGVFLKGGVTLDYNVSANSNQKELEGTTTKIGIVPMFSFGYVAVVDYDTRTSSGTLCGMIGPFVSYNVMNMTSIANASIRYMTFGLTYTIIKF